MPRDYAPVKFDMVIDGKTIARGQLDVSSHGVIQDVQLGNQLCPIEIQYQLCSYLRDHIDHDFLKAQAETHFGENRTQPVGKIG